MTIMSYDKKWFVSWMFNEKTTRIFPVTPFFTQKKN